MSLSVKIATTCWPASPVFLTVRYRSSELFAPTTVPDPLPSADVIVVIPSPEPSMSTKGRMKSESRLEVVDPGLDLDEVRVRGGGVGDPGHDFSKHATCLNRIGGVRAHDQRVRIPARSVSVRKHRGGELALRVQRQEPARHWLDGKPGCRSPWRRSRRTPRPARLRRQRCRSASDRESATTRAVIDSAIAARCFLICALPLVDRVTNVVAEASTLAANAQ